MLALPTPALCSSDFVLLAMALFALYHAAVELADRRILGGIFTGCAGFTVALVGGVAGAESFFAFMAGRCGGGGCGDGRAVAGHAAV